MSSAPREPAAAGDARAGVPDLEAQRADLMLALRSEFGARSLYPWLSWRVGPGELREVLRQVAREERQLVAELRQLLAEIGGDPPNSSLRRQCISLLIGALTLPFGARFALRLCLDAEETVGRWYDAHAACFASRGESQRARRCESLSLTKRRHAQVLRTFLSHAADGGGEF